MNWPLARTCSERIGTRTALGAAAALGPPPDAAARRPALRRCAARWDRRDRHRRRCVPRTAITTSLLTSVLSRIRRRAAIDARQRPSGLRSRSVPARPPPTHHAPAAARPRVSSSRRKSHRAGSGFVAHADADSAQGAGRRQLWDNPSGPLPDVYVSETSLFLAEGEATQYTVSLTTTPGMREDTTVRTSAGGPGAACPLGLD